MALITKCDEYQPRCERCNNPEIAACYDFDNPHYKCNDCGQLYGKDEWENFVEDCATPAIIRIYPERGMSFTKLIAKVYLNESKTHVHNECPEVGGMTYQRLKL